MGQYTGGQLWLCDPSVPPHKAVERCSAKGEVLRGKLINTKHKLFVFNPDVVRDVEPWAGFRLSITVYANRALTQLTPEQSSQLKLCGFPRGKSAQAILVHTPPAATPAALKKVAFDCVHVSVLDEENVCQSASYPAEEAVRRCLSQDIRLSQRFRLLNNIRLIWAMIFPP